MIKREPVIKNNYLKKLLKKSKKGLQKEERIIKKLSEESADKKQERLAKRRANYKK